MRPIVECGISISRAQARRWTCCLIVTRGASLAEVDLRTFDVQLTPFGWAGICAGWHWVPLEMLLHGRGPLYDSDDPHPRLS